MNCKEGDLAIVVKTGPSHKDALGKIVRCIRVWGIASSGLIAWETIPVVGNQCVEDIALRPIRNEPGADETLTWCDVPKGVSA